jgi:hypothetical protein
MRKFIEKAEEAPENLQLKRRWALNFKKKNLVHLFLLPFIIHSQT